MIVLAERIFYVSYLFISRMSKMCATIGFGFIKEFYI